MFPKIAPLVVALVLSPPLAVAQTVVPPAVPANLEAPAGSEGTRRGHLRILREPS